MHTNILSVWNSQSERHSAGFFTATHTFKINRAHKRELDTLNTRVKHQSQLKNTEKDLLHIRLYLKDPPIRSARARESNGDPHTAWYIKLTSLRISSLYYKKGLSAP